jgi:riboflavin synthase
MFTGIIETVGQIKAIERSGGDARLHIDRGGVDPHGLKLGDSVAVNGVCLTVTDLPSGSFRADASAETLHNTTLGELRSGSPVNLETALKAGAPLGGHLVSGHVDGVGHVSRFYQQDRSWRLHIQAPSMLARYIARKGSICLDGVSLTVNSVSGAEFEVNIVPHTLQQTTLAAVVVGQRVNLEVDMIARYLERLLAAEPATDSGGVNTHLLRERGFLS